MLSFEEFKEYVLNNFKAALPEGHENVELSINTVTKNNGRELTGLTVRAEESDIAPNLYLDGVYSDYVKGKNPDAIMKELADVYLKNESQVEEFANIGKVFKDFNQVKDKIVMVVIGRERNAVLLSGTPHTNCEDMALIYKVLVGVNSTETATITIKNEYLDIWGVTKDEIHALAVKNTRELLPVTVRSLNEVMLEKQRAIGVLPEEMLEEMRNLPADAQQYVITNSTQANGAAAIFYEDVLSGLAEKIGTDLYILPSSIHECIAMSVNMGEAEGLAEMVAEINRYNVATEEQLTDHVYRFDAKEKTLKIADTSLEALGLDQENDLARPVRRGR